MKKVLIITPHFPPTNAPDHHRIRMALPYFREFGWEPHVLALESDSAGMRDEALERSIPSDVRVTRVRPISSSVTGIFGVRGLSWRGLYAVYQSGRKLLAEEQYDMIYFSTTLFLFMALGPLWKRRFKVPYVLDFQDPWRSDYYAESGNRSRPPGGRIKYAASQMIARLLEPQALRSADFVTSVSPAYPESLRKRYPWFEAGRCEVLPFGAAKRDFELLEQWRLKQRFFSRGDGKFRFVYVGRGGSDMAPSLRNLFESVRKLCDEAPESWKSVEFYFVGTSYAPQHLAQKSVEQIARECGIGKLVHEFPERVPYFEALQILADGDAILLIGSDDPGYSPSKVFPCILARKPIVAVLHEQSLVCEIIRKSKAGEVVTFSSGNERGEITERISEVLRYTVSPNGTGKHEINWEYFEQFSARSMTHRLADIFDRVST